MDESIPLATYPLWEMKPLQALQLLQRNRAISKPEAKELRQLHKSGEPIPERLQPALDLLFLAMVRTPTPSLH